MEYLEGILRFLRIDRQPKVPALSPRVEATTLWTYQYLREYLLALTKGKDFLLPQWKYPEVIELNKAWQDVFDKLSANTVNGIEYLALIGYKSEKKALFLPTTPIKGQSRRISGETFDEEVTAATIEHGLDGVIGYIHSHTSESDDVNFSSGDLYWLVSNRHVPFVLGLTGLSKNMMAFQTQETLRTFIDPSTVPQDSFRSYWNQKGSNTTITNLAIAKQHHLVLYKGEAGERLNRVYP